MWAKLQPVTRCGRRVAHTGVIMTVNKKAVRQSVTLPAKVAQQVRSMAKRRRLSASRMLVELVVEGIELQKQKEKAFFDLAERLRAATNPGGIERIGNELGKMVFGKLCQRSKFGPRSQEPSSSLQSAQGTKKL